MMIKFGESGHPVFRATSPLSRGTLKSKGGGKLSFHFWADGDTIETVFRTIISVNQLSIHGAVPDVCEEHSACQTITWRPVLAGQSDPLFEPAKLLITTPTPSVEILALHREEDEAIEFWRSKEYVRHEFEHYQYWSDDVWKSKMAGGGGNKKIFHHCTDSSGQEILYLRALQGHSGRNPIDLTLQDNVLIPDNFFEYIYHIGCAESVCTPSQIQD